MIDRHPVKSTREVWTLTLRERMEPMHMGEPVHRVHHQIDYNTYRPHSSLGRLTPFEFAEQCRQNLP